LSLVYIEISDKIRDINSLEKISFDYFSKENIEFDDSNIDKQVRDRINFWVEDIIISSTADYSHMLTIRLINLLEKKEDDILEFVSVVFAFFLKDINISIHKSDAINISMFII